MFGFGKRKEKDLRILAPASGHCIPLESVNDPVFSSGAMGQGVALQWQGEVVCSPCRGKVIMTAATGHAVGLAAENGLEILLHIGMDTVELGGQGFRMHVKTGQSVDPGDRLVSVDRRFMEEKGIDLTMPVVVTSGQNLQILAAGRDVSTADELFRAAPEN